VWLEAMCRFLRWHYPDQVFGSVTAVTLSAH